MCVRIYEYVYVFSYILESSFSKTTEYIRKRFQKTSTIFSGYSAISKVLGLEANIPNLSEFTEHWKFRRGKKEKQNDKM